MMYAHTQDWPNATRVARTADPSAMNDIFMVACFAFVVEARTHMLCTR